MGHKIVPSVPSLFTFNIKSETLKDLPGTSFPFAEVSIPKFKTAESGPLLITHWGLSGPAILKISAWQAIALAALKYRFDIVVNFLGIGKNKAEELFKKSTDELQELGLTKPPSVELSLAVPSLGYCKSMDELKSKLVAQLSGK